MEPPEELESPYSILQVWRLTSQPRRRQLLAEQAGLAPAGDLTTPQRLSKPRSYGFLSTAPIKNSKARLHFRIKNSLQSSLYAPLKSDWRKERDSNPRTLADQRFSRPPRSTTLPSLRNKKFKTALPLSNARTSPTKINYAFSLN